MIHPGATILPFEGKHPQIHETAFVAPGARIIGDVTIGPEVSVWYNGVLRGDIHRIEVGARSNVQDGSVFHVEGPRPDTDGCPTIVGEDCVIGNMAVVHGCTLEDCAFVGMGAVAPDELRGAVQVGLTLRADCWGQGYAREAAQAALALAFERQGLPRVYAQTSERNTASWGLMERLGMQRRADLDYPDADYPPEDNPTMVYSLDAADWRARAAASAERVDG